MPLGCGISGCRLQIMLSIYPNIYIVTFLCHVNNMIRKLFIRMYDMNIA